jgi:RNA polymerase sigma-70 factor (ECF subfamily)
MDSDHDLILRIQKRDADAPDALAELYRRYGGYVYSLTVAILGESAAAQEVTQDSFLKIWAHPEHYRREEGRFAAWLLTIARRSAIDRLRRDKRRIQTAVSLDRDDAPELHDPGQEEELSWQDMSHVLDDLPDEQRAVILLAYYRGLTQSEIAAHLHLPLGTVKTRLRIGMEKLRALWHHQQQ